MSEGPIRLSQGGSDRETKLTKDGTLDRRFKEHGGGTHGNQGGRETGFEEIDDGASRLRTKAASKDAGICKLSRVRNTGLLTTAPSQSMASVETARARQRQARRKVLLVTKMRA